MENLILELPNSVPPEFCEEMIRRFEKDNNKFDGVVTYNSYTAVEPTLKKSTELFVSGLDSWKDIDIQLKKYMYEALIKYINYINDYFKNDQKFHIFETIVNRQAFSDVGYYIHRTDAGDKYAWHHDGGFNCTNFLNVILYLKTLEEGDGGTTDFLNGTRIRPEIGKILFFPASWTFPHRGDKVLNGPKYTCCSIIHYGPSPRF
jgi:hypothetical protein